MPHKPHPEPYHVGDVVPEEGKYVCVPCGFRRKLKAGQTFSECVSCLKDEGWHAAGEEQDEEDRLLDGTDIEKTGHHYHTDEGEEVAEGMELWEKAQKPEDADKEKQA